MILAFSCFFGTTFSKNLQKTKSNYEKSSKIERVVLFKYRNIVSILGGFSYGEGNLEVDFGNA
jgi:hypothetical protein